jgi:hypothetical protein
METIVQLLGSVAGLISLICLIMVVIKLFQAEGALKGILGVICGLYTFIWGWMNVSKNNNRNIMLLWSIAIGVALIFNVAGAVLIGAQGGLVPQQ